jgi:type II secretory pathway pseudopilin PulG
MRIVKKNQQGFSYIDVMIAIVILMVGILAMLSALTANLIRSFQSEKRVVAKQLALSTVESVISAKEMNRVGVIQGFDSLRNSDQPAILDPSTGNQIFGIFLPGFNPIRDEDGWDGVAGTVDDACAVGGPCTVAGRTTNTSSVKDGFMRQIIITDIDDPERPTASGYPIARRRVEVHIRYFANQIAMEEVASTILTNYGTSQ